MRIPLQILFGMLFFGIVIALSTFSFLHNKTTRSDAYIRLQSIGVQKGSLGSSTFNFFIADTDEEKTHGLSGVISMNDNEGVLFRFAHPANTVFWMKDMQFPLDFVYVHNNRVVELKENILPSSYPNTIVNKQIADIVIELNAGQIRKKSIKVGDVLELDLSLIHI